MTSSTLSGNAVTAKGLVTSGGGAAVTGTASLTESVISGNAVTNSSPLSSSKASLAQGGGLAAGKAFLVRSLISNNSVSVVHGFAYGSGISSLTSAYGGPATGPTEVLIFSLISTISGNTAHSDAGWSYGGVAVGKASSGSIPAFGAADIAFSTVSGNIVSSDCADCSIHGGGISAFGQVTLDGSTVRDNQALLTSSSTGAAYDGGVATRIPSDSSSGTGFTDGLITVGESTISGNKANGGTACAGRGGGLAALMSPLDLKNSTIAFNQASSSGGGAGRERGR